MTVQVKEIPEAVPFLRAMCLARLSTKEQLAGAGLQRQIDSINAICRQKGYMQIEIVEEVAVSGTAVMDSPKIQRLLQMAEDGEYDVLVVSEMSRLVRPAEFNDMSILDTFMRNNILIDAGGTIHDFKNKGTFMLSGISALMAGGERIEMLEKMKTSKEVRRREGKCPASERTLPTGISYDREQERYTVNKDIAKVQEAFRLYVNEGIHSLVELSRRVGIKPRTLKSIFRNPAFKGERRYDCKRSATQKYSRPDAKQADRPKIKRAPEEVIEVRIFEPEDQPVTDEQWEAANKILDQSRANFYDVRGCPYPHAISGIGGCDFCMEPLIGVSAPSHRRRKGHRGHYICKSHHYTNKGKLPKCGQSRLDKQKLEDTLIAFTHQKLCDEVLVREMVEASNKLKSQRITAFEAPAPEELMEKLKQREQKLMDAYEADIYSIEELKDRRGKLEREKLLIQKDMVNMEAQDDLKEGGSNFQIEAPLISKAGNIHEISDPHERREILHSLFVSVLFRGYSITAFRFAPNILPSGGPTAFPGICTEGYVTLPQPFRIYDDGSEPAKRRKPRKRRKCNKCGKTKPLDEFNRKTKAGGDGPENRRKTCAECYRQQNRDRARKRKEEGNKL